MCSNARGVTNNVELRTLDATANPYIALAAIIAAGLLVREEPCMATAGTDSICEHQVHGGEPLRPCFQSPSLVLVLSSMVVSSGPHAEAC